MQLHTSFAQTLADDLQPIYLRADPNGVAYDPAADALYVADSHTGAIIAIGPDRQRRIATIESGGVLGARVGGLALAPDGTLYATRIGHGRAGAIFRISADGRTEALPRLAHELKRVGVAYDPVDDVLYTAQYRPGVHGPHDGTVAMVDLATGDVATVFGGFAKPTGLAVIGDSLVVADARRRAVFRIRLAGGRATACTLLAGDIGRPDSVCAFDPDSVLVTTYDEEAQRGSLCRLWLDGRTTTIVSGPWHPRGVTSDGDRAFVAMRRGGRVMVFRVEPSG